MGKVNNILEQRLKKGDKSSKMAALAKQSASGNLTSFSGIFSTVELTETEKGMLSELLMEYNPDEIDTKDDLESLIELTCEVKAINNQAAILHGERIKKAQAILKDYKEGAFSAWLIAAYGNRQTPYNFLQYYEFCEAMPKTLRPRIELMPRQAVYTLASRNGMLSHKQTFVENYKGQTKQELLILIRDIFPLDSKDKRLQNTAEYVIKDLRKALYHLRKKQRRLTAEQKATICELLDNINPLVR